MQSLLKYPKLAKGITTLSLEKPTVVVLQPGGAGNTLRVGVLRPAENTANELLNLLPSLESLTLTGLSLSNHSPLSRTDKFAKLKSLRIVRSTDLDTAAGLLIGHIDRLRHLYLKQISRSRLAEFLIALVNKGSAIESLVMKDLDPSENPLDLSVLSPSTSLRSLTLTSPNTSPDKFWPLTCTRPLATVEHLRLVRVALSETMLWDLPVLFPNLKTLQIEDCSGVSETKANPLQIFSQLRALRLLRMVNTFAPIDDGEARSLVDEFPALVDLQTDMVPLPDDSTPFVNKNGGEVEVTVL